jgi:uncharacterized protein YndB with AHSA1/START domain
MFLAWIALAAAQPAPAQQPPLPPVRMSDPFEAMAFLVGHCWRGEFRSGTQDTHCFEPVYGRRFIRDRHEVTGGYAGETLYSWNAVEGRVEYTYWNSSGGISRGTMRARNGLLDFGDETYRARDGRETRYATTWHRIDDSSYEVRVTSAADPTGNRVTRYTRLDAAPVAIAATSAADGTRTLTHEIIVPAPPEQVYAAFAAPEGWRTWAVPNAWTSAGDPELFETSYTPGAVAGDARNIQQRYVLRVPNRLIAFRTVRTPPGFPHAAEFQRVTTLVELEPTGTGTRVRLSGIGYPAGPAGDTLLGFFREGNRTSLEQLRTRFVSGPIDWAARRAAERR